jgi:c-di-GMP-binding flagellar brake protein YcgR
MKLILDQTIEDENGLPIQFEENQLVTLNFIEAERIRTVTTRILSLETTREQLTLDLDAPHDVNTNQRRTYFRLDTHDFRKKLENTEQNRARVLDIGITILPFTRMVTTGIKPYKTELINISAGGLLVLFTEVCPPINTLLKLRLLIPKMGVIECMGRVARIEKSETHSSRFLIGISYLEIREEDREKILDYTYGCREILQTTSEE